MKPYPAYKDSGVEWLGQVPEGWGVEPVKVRFSVVGGTTPKPDQSAFWDGDIPWITPADLSSLPSRFISETGRQITQLGLESCGTKVVSANSVVLSTRAPIGSIAITTVPACVNQGCKLLVPKADSDTGYYYYALLSAREQLNLLGRGSTFLELSGDQLAAFRVLFPPLPEQQAIAAFLDRETAKIDGLIEQQRRLIALLAEKRQATISHAVTRGLNPSARLKPSGVDWLGDVPEGWEVVRLKQVARVQTGIAKGKEVSAEKSAEIPYLRVANVQDGYIDLTEVATIEIDADQVSRYLLRAGDVLMNEGGDFDKLGRGAIWHDEISPCIHQNHVFAVRTIHVSPEWLSTVIGTNYAKFYFMVRSKQSTNLASISSTNLMELPVVMPPDNEQAEILAAFQRDKSDIDALAETATSAITLLQERRAALISAAVTGKIDVRDLAAVRDAA